MKLLLILFFSALTIVFMNDAEEAEKADDLYCEMVKMHMSDPSAGWPDYKGVYDAQCK
jgi:hypothetical protein